MSRLTVNPFEVMRRAYGDKLQFPRPLRGDRSEEALLAELRRRRRERPSEREACSVAGSVIPSRSRLSGRARSSAGG